MRQLFLKNGAVQLQNIAQPSLHDDVVLVRTHYSFISSGTEGATIGNAVESAHLFGNLRHKFSKVIETLQKEGLSVTKNLIRAKLKGSSWQQLGYSAVGQVVAVGNNITTLSVGDFVACAGAGIANHAEFLAVPYHLAAKVTDPAFLEQASITTLGAISLQGIRRADLKLGELVCVIGLGLLGQLTVQLAVIAGCRVIGIDPLAERRNLALKSGATAVFDPHDAALERSIQFMSSHHGVDTTFITAASKSDALTQQAMQLTRRKGKVIIVGDVGLGLKRDPLYKKEIDVLISCSYGPGRYDSSYEQKGVDYPYAYVRWTQQRNMQLIVELIEQKKLVVDHLISTTIKLEDASQAYELLKKQEALGIVLAYDASSPSVQACSPDLFASVKKKYATSLNVGVIGAGGFATIKLLPFIANLKNVVISSIVDPNPVALLSTGELYKAATLLTNDTALFTDEALDAILIASPHVHHAAQIAQALSNNKAVFSEKPMVTSYEQLEQLKSVFREHPDAALCVDYNRSFSPFMQAVKRAITNRSTPLMIYYRMNAGFISQEHWVQQEAIGGGRIVGEACHIVDLFCFLTGSPASSINLEVLSPCQDSLNKTDNFVSSIRFADGSICTLLYTATGNSAAGKEYMELFFDGKTIIMDDYKTLQGYGLGNAFNQTSSMVQKGHEQLLEQFFSSLRPEIKNRKNPQSFEHLEHVSYITLVMNDLARQSGGERVV